MRLHDFDSVYENMDHSKDGRAVPELKAALTAHSKEIQSATDDQVYDIIDRMMTRIAKSHGISGQKLHDMWVDKYGQIPDTWVMKIKENLEKGVTEEFTNYQGLRTPKNEPGVNLFPGKDIVGRRVYHCTNNLEAIKKSGGLKPRRDATGEREYGRLSTDEHPFIPVIGVWFSVGKPDWVGKHCLSFVIEPTDQVYVAYTDTKGLYPNVVLNPIALDRLTVEDQQGIAEGTNDTVYPNAEVIKSKNGKPVGEIYQDGNSWGCFHYRADRGYDFIDSREDAIEALRDLHQETGRSRPDYTIKGVAEEGYGNHPSQRVDPRTGKKYVPPKSPLGQGVAENFHDGRNPQDKGDSKRHGIPKHTTLSQLDKIGHGSGRKAQLARWQANMRRGRAK